MRTERHDIAFVIGAVVGGLTAAAVTLFRAPQPGAQTRADIQARLRPVTSKTAGPTRFVVDQAQAVTNQVMEKGEEVATSVKSKVRSQDQSGQQDTDQIAVVEPRATVDLEPSLYSGVTSDDLGVAPVQPDSPTTEAEPRPRV